MHDHVAALTKAAPPLRPGARRWSSLHNAKLSPTAGQAPPSGPPKADPAGTEPVAVRVVCAVSLWDRRRDRDYSLSVT
ncbi:uncharacterized protein B0I36DRAFT_311471 [Microdochium trichocladiopsis]|uniref:Uncharacterized protein n=1 Tax=Microdochium trichocladiopsis TaxID=1682393 RepID=A0A9P8YIA4_9PEZI|nr:uncharacterized protein B0I36DRAFT_311471 [Microdochium trichocladiopsis]KAH7040790.1 hypothetical protein B0I36DRAFT_311471 [Microdochium trichocladiopsis]